MTHEKLGYITDTEMLAADWQQASPGKEKLKATSCEVAGTWRGGRSVEKVLSAINTQQPSEWINGGLIGNIAVYHLDLLTNVHISCILRMRGSKDCCNQPNTANRKVEVLGDGVEAVGVSCFCVRKRGHQSGEYLSR